MRSVQIEGRLDGRFARPGLHGLDLHIFGRHEGGARMGVPAEHCDLASAKTPRDRFDRATRRDVRVVREMVSSAGFPVVEGCACEWWHVRLLGIGFGD